MLLTVVLVAIVGVAMVVTQRPATNRSPAATPMLDLSGVDPGIRDGLADHLRALGERPDDPAVHGRLGRALHAEQVYGIARQCYEHARALDPNDATWWYYLGRLDRRAGLHAQAVDDLRRTVELRPDYAPAHLVLAEQLLDDGELDDAETHLARYTSLAPTEPAGKVALGRLARARKQPAEARRHLEAALQLRPDHAAAHYHLGLVLRTLGESELAAKHMDTSRRINRLGPAQDPDDPLMAQVARAAITLQGMIDYATTAQAAGRTGETLEICERIIRQNPDEPNAHFMYARFLLQTRSRQPQLVEQHLRRAIELDPRFTEAMSYLSGLLIATGRGDEGQALHRQVIARRPNDALVHFNYGVALDEAGQSDQAVDALRKAIQLDPDAAAMHWRLGLVLQRVRRFEEAADAMRAAVRAGSYDATYFIALAQVLAALGQFDEAATHLHEALRLAPGRGDAHFGLACVYAQTDRRDDALTALRNSVRLKYATRTLCERVPALASLRDDPRYAALFAEPSDSASTR